MSTVEITPRVTEYEVCAWPEGDINAEAYVIKVAYRGRGLWAVIRRGLCINVNGGWDREPIPSERTDEWLAAHRFDEQTALRLATDQARRDALTRRERRTGGEE